MLPSGWLFEATGPPASRLGLLVFLTLTFTAFSYCQAIYHMITIWVFTPTGPNLRRAGAVSCSSHYASALKVPGT